MDHQSQVSEAPVETPVVTGVAVADTALVNAPELDDDSLVAEVERLRDNLKSANKELDAFVHAASQDLRGFLRGISVSVHEVLTNHQNQLEASSREELTKIAESVRRMGLIMDDMLKLTALTRAELKTEELDLSYLAGEIAKDVAKRHSQAELQISIQPNIVAKGDERLVAAVLERLLDNACRYASQSVDRKVEFGVTLVNSKRAYWVKDSGPGFPPHQAHRIFEPVEKLNEAHGAGMGLSAVKRIIERHGGKVWAHSLPGQGATFCFTLGEKALP